MDNAHTPLAQPANAPLVPHEPRTHHWIGTFAARLMQMRPGLGMGPAVQYAVSEFHHIAGVDPVRAAEIFHRQMLAAAAAMAPSALNRRPGSSTAFYRQLFAARNGEPRLPAGNPFYQEAQRAAANAARAH